jgi:hypothetical protein
MAENAGQIPIAAGAEAEGQPAAAGQVDAPRRMRKRHRVNQFLPRKPRKAASAYSMFLKDFYNNTPPAPGVSTLLSSLSPSPLKPGQGHCPFLLQLPLSRSVHGRDFGTLRSNGATQVRQPVRPTVIAVLLTRPATSEKWRFGSNNGTLSSALPPPTPSSSRTFGM